MHFSCHGALRITPSGVKSKINDPFHHYSLPPFENLQKYARVKICKLCQKTKMTPEGVILSLLELDSNYSFLIIPSVYPNN